MKEPDPRAELNSRAPGQWELYRKTAESHELTATAGQRRRAWRREEGWAARWWEGESGRFACGSTPQALARAIRTAETLRLAPSPPPHWPQTRSPNSQAESEVEEPPDLFADLARQLSAESRGEAQLFELTLRRGFAVERIENGRGLAIAQGTGGIDGIAQVIGRRGARACEARAVFRWDAEPNVVSIARRLADRAVLPLSERSTPISRGEWLLGPSVAAALLAGIGPLFLPGSRPRWLSRSRFASEQVTVVDDACADAPFDGEGTLTRRVLLVDRGDIVGSLYDLASAARAGERSTGHGVRPSYRLPPAAGPRRFFFETAGAAAPQELLSSVRRGLFAAALTAPPRLDLAGNRFEVEFTGIAVVNGRAQSPVAGARARGRLSQFWRRVAGLATDRQFFPMPYPSGAPTLLIERADFD